MYGVCKKYRTLEDIQSIIDDKIDESENLEYKAPELDENSLSERFKKEKIPKEIAALANSGGGTFIIGIKSNEKLPSEIIPIRLNESDCNRLKESLFQIISTKIKPPVYGVEINFVVVEENKVVLVIDVPDSYAAPHAYYRNGAEQIDYLTRYGNITVCMSPEMLHSIFLRSEDISKKIDYFSKQRIDVIKTRQSMPMMITHIIPYSISDKYSSNNDMIEKIRCELYDWKIINSESYNENGLKLTNGGSTSVQMFRNGAIEFNYQIKRNDEGLAWKAGELKLFKLLKMLSEINVLKKPWVVRSYVLNSGGLTGSWDDSGFWTYYNGCLESDFIQSDDAFYDGTKTIEESSLCLFDSLANAFGEEKSIIINYMRDNYDWKRIRL